MRAIYRDHLATPEAQAELEALAELVRSGRRICLLCFEAVPPTVTAAWSPARWVP